MKMGTNFNSFNTCEATLISICALKITHGDQLILITGCAHPGIVKIINQVLRDFGKAPTLVLGGFHFYKTPQKTILTICSASSSSE